LQANFTGELKEIPGIGAGHIRDASKLTLTP
jgi:hypothetical protein